MNPGKKSYGKKIHGKKSHNIITILKLMMVYIKKKKKISKIITKH